MTTADVPTAPGVERDGTGRRKTEQRAVLHLAVGPALFAAVVLLGGGVMDYPVRRALGLLLWMSG